MEFDFDPVIGIDIVSSCHIYRGRRTSEDFILPILKFFKAKVKGRNLSVS